MGSLVITMAGESRRFREQGILTPKYRLVVRDRTLFSWSLVSLTGFIDAGWRVVLVGRDLEIEGFAAGELKQLGCTDFDLVVLDAPTDGQASTALAASRVVAPDDPLLIYNIDTHVDPAVLPTRFDGAGWLPCFPGRGSGWSFVGVDEGDNVTEVREKVRISDHATVGLYGFDSFSRFAEAYGEANDAVGAAEKSERYVAPLYNVLIDKGLRVTHTCLPVEAVVPLGTPEEVRQFKG